MGLNVTWGVWGQFHWRWARAVWDVHIASMGFSVCFCAGSLYASWQAEEWPTRKWEWRHHSASFSQWTKLRESSPRQFIVSLFKLSTIWKTFLGNNHCRSRSPGSHHSSSRCTMKLKVWLLGNSCTQCTWPRGWVLQLKGLGSGVVSDQGIREVSRL